MDDYSYFCFTYINRKYIHGGKTMLDREIISDIQTIINAINEEKTFGTRSFYIEESIKCEFFFTGNYYKLFFEGFPLNYLLLKNGKNITLEELINNLKEVLK